MHSPGVYLSPQLYGLEEAFDGNDVCCHAAMHLVALGGLLYSAEGGLMVFGVLFMLFAPTFAARARGLSGNAV